MVLLFRCASNKTAFNTTIAVVGLIYIAAESATLVCVATRLCSDLCTDRIFANSSLLYYLFLDGNFGVFQFIAPCARIFWNRYLALIVRLGTLHRHVSQRCADSISSLTSSKEEPVCTPLRKKKQKTKV